MEKIRNHIIQLQAPGPLFKTGHVVNNIKNQKGD